MMLLRSGYPLPSDLDSVGSGLRGADRDQYAGQIRKEVADLLRTQPANSVSDLDHFFTLGVAMKSVWPGNIEFFDEKTKSYFEQHVGAGDSAPGLIAFVYGLRGRNFNDAMARVFKETTFSPQLVRTDHLKVS